MRNHLLADAIIWARKSARILSDMQKNARIIKNKGEGDFALDADIASENFLLNKIRKKYPDHSIFTEESGSHVKKEEYLWVIDPLEGTLNYKHNIPFYAVNIGLFRKGVPLLGVVYAPVLDELFYAYKGKGAFLNGKRIHVNNDSDIAASFFSGNASHLASLRLSRHLMRSLGCTGLELCYVACGRFGARVKTSGNDPFGYGPSSAILSEAGAILTDVRGREWGFKSNGCVASNGILHKKILRLIRH